MQTLDLQKMSLLAMDNQELELVSGGGFLGAIFGAAASIIGFLVGGPVVALVAAAVGVIIGEMFD